MQKWCPRSFDTDEVAGGQFCAGMPVAAAEGLPPLAATITGPPPQKFRKEAGFADGKALMSHLTPEERGQVFELVELDVAKEYSAREEQVRAACDLECEQARQEFLNWGAEYAEQADRQMREIARSCVRLAFQIAERIVRAKVANDPEALIRAVESTLFKVQSTRPLTLTVNPEDAAWLDQQPELRKRLRIGELVADRRVSRGGCRLECHGQEWDATLRGQIDALAELLEEAMAEAPAARALPEGSADEPALG